VARRRAVNPAKVKADHARLRAPAAPRVGRWRHLQLGRRLTTALLCLLSAVLLSVAFPPYDCWYVAYIALVPWALAVVWERGPKAPLLCTAVAAVLFWAGNLYWLTWITLVGYAAAAVYLAAYWVVAAGLLRAAWRRGVPAWIVLPVVWVALEYARAYVIGGFPWFYLGHTQYRQVRLLQIADATGAYGVSFFVALVNGLLVDAGAALLGVRPDAQVRPRRRLIGGAAVAGVLLGGLLGYGTWRLGQETKEAGPVLGIAQGAFPIYLHRSIEKRKELVPTYCDLSNAFENQPVDLVVWPESSLLAGMNRQALELLRPGREPPAPAVARMLRHLQRQGHMLPGLWRLAEEVGARSARLGCPILAGGASWHVQEAVRAGWDEPILRNSAAVFDGGPLPVWRYAKIKLVPFSEHVPFRGSAPRLYRFLRGFVPEVMRQMEPGRGPQRYALEARGRTWRLATPICYEGTFARTCRRLIMDDGRKKADVLVNLSNDGWFVWPGAAGQYRRSAEHPVHLSHYVFRAIENRVPVVRAVNTGISASITSDGRMDAILRKHGRTLVEGTLLLDGARRNPREYERGHGGKVLVDRRVSLYSRVGDVFAWAVSASAAGLIVVLALRRRGVKKRKTL